MQHQSQLPEVLPFAESVLLSKPSFDLPEVAADLTLIGDDELMAMFSHAVGWQNFAASVSVEAEVREADCEYEMEKAESEAVVAAWGGTSKDRVTVAKAQRALDPKVNELRQKWLAAKAARKRAQVVRDNCERIVNLISRELTRRVGRESTDRRQQRWNP